MKPSNSTFRRLGSWAILNSNGAAKIKPKLGELLKSLEANKQDGVLQHQIPILQVQPSEALSSPQFSKIRFKFRQTVVMIMMMWMIKMISLKPYQSVITPAMMMTRTTKHCNGGHHAYGDQVQVRATGGEGRPEAPPVLD